MNTIGNLLFEYRKKHQLTQQELVEKLSHYSNHFHALNSVTLSRWETGTTSPSLKKKHTLLCFFFKQGAFESGKCYEIIHERYKNLSMPLEKVFIKNYQALIGNLPERIHHEHTFYTLKDFPHKQEHIEHIIDIETASNTSDYYRITPQVLEEWSQHASNLCIICEHKKQHLGHFIMLKIKNRVAKEIAYNDRSEFILHREDFCMPHENGTYYIHALYGRSPKIAAILSVYGYLHLLEHLDKTDNVMIFSTRTDGVLLTKDYGIKTVANGKNAEYGFSWHGMLSPTPDILFSETVLKLVF